MDWPTVGVLIVTWNRPNEIRRAIKALQQHLKYRGKLHWHLADDNSPGTYLDDIKADFPDITFSQTVTDRKGWGANVNAGLKHLNNLSFIFSCEDDYLAFRDIDLTRGVALMVSNEELGLVRYDGIAAHGERGMELSLRSVKRKKSPNKVPYLIIKKSSAHLNIYSNRPHLKAKCFHAKYGLYPTGVPLAKTEQQFARRFKAGSGPEIAILPDYLFTPFRHIGKSWQGSQSDVGKGKKRKKKGKKRPPKKAAPKPKQEVVVAKGTQLRLNIGCGMAKKKGFVGVDMVKTPAVQVQTSAWDLPYSPNTVAEIFTSHMIEHLTPDQQDQALKEWHRVLKLGAKLTIRCPNFELYVKEYLDATEDQRFENVWLLRNIFGWRNKPGQFHYDGFTVGRFERLLPKYGFKVVSCKATRTRASKGIEYRPSGDVICVAIKAGQETVEDNECY